MHVKYKYKVHALETTNSNVPKTSNNTFYETKQDAYDRARECIRNGCTAIVIYEALTVVTPTRPEVECHDVD